MPPIMEIIILGSGTFVPELKRHCSGYLIKVRNKNLIFDFGRGTLDSLMNIGVEYYDIDKIFISHTHADHCSEIIALLQVFLDFVWTNFPKPNKQKLKNKIIEIYGPRGIKKTIYLLLKAFSLNKYKCVDMIKIKELSDGDIVKGNGYEVKSFKVEHSRKLRSLAYRIESNKKKILYGGDSKYCKGLKNACMDADIAIIEATLPKELVVEAHISREDVGKLAKESNIKRVVLTHIHSIFLNRITKEIRKFYKGPITIAKDLTRIKI